jgi:hypothetical protein
MSIVPLERGFDQLLNLAASRRLRERVHRGALLQHGRAGLLISSLAAAARWRRLARQAWAMARLSMPQTDLPTRARRPERTLVFVMIFPSVAAHGLEHFFIVVWAAHDDLCLGRWSALAVSGYASSMADVSTRGLTTRDDDLSSLGRARDGDPLRPAAGTSSTSG